jgi:23S rRNA pseudouridine2605 synthase
MRINQYIALNSHYSRREADELLADQRVAVNGLTARLGQQVTDQDTVAIDNQALAVQTKRYVLMHKPVGYVCSRHGQGAPTVYGLLPDELSHLQTVGRLDKDSSGLILLTNDGAFAHEMTHPKFAKEKVYHVTLDRNLSESDQTTLNGRVELEDGTSTVRVSQLPAPSAQLPSYEVRMREGRNRQIRRTFDHLGYTVRALHRTTFGPYTITGIEPAQIKEVDRE